MYLYFCVCPLNNDPLNLHTNPYNIAVTQQRVSLVSLGYLCKNSIVVPFSQVSNCVERTTL